MTNLAERLKKHAYEVDYAIPIKEREKANSNNKYFPKPTHLNNKIVIGVSGLVKELENEEKANIFLCNEARKDKKDFANVAGGQALAYGNLKMVLAKIKKEKTQ